MNRNERPRSFEYHPLPLGTVIRLKSMFPDLGALLLDAETREAIARAQREGGQAKDDEEGESIAQPARPPRR